MQKVLLICEPYDKFEIEDLNKAEKFAREIFDLPMWGTQAGFNHYKGVIRDFKKKHSIFGFSVLLLYRKAKNISRIIKFCKEENVTVYPMSFNLYLACKHEDEGT